MKLIDLKIIKEETVYKRVLDELKLKGLNNLYIKKTDSVDYIDIILATINFLEQNKKIINNLPPDKFENIVIIVIDEILEDMNINITEENIEKIIELLKNSLLVKKVSKFLIVYIKKFYNNLRQYFSNKCCTASENI